jgi:hypothetical protein
MVYVLKDGPRGMKLTKIGPTPQPRAMLVAQDGSHVRHSVDRCVEIWVSQGSDGGRTSQPLEAVMGLQAPFPRRQTEEGANHITGQLADQILHAPSWQRTPSAQTKRNADPLPTLTVHEPVVGDSKVAGMCFLLGISKTHRR